MTRKAALVIVLGIIQLIFAFSIISQHEIVLEKGDMHKFRARPIDPYDAFRGRYVSLYGVGGTQVSVAPEVKATFNRGDMVYGILSKDEEGFSFISSLSREKPEDENYVKVKVSYVPPNGNTVNYIFPIDRYYMKEDLAPKAESKYWQSRLRGQKPAYVKVMIDKGDAVLEGLYIEDKRIEEWVR